VRVDAFALDTSVVTGEGFTSDSTAVAQVGFVWLGAQGYIEGGGGGPGATRRPVVVVAG
jgi:hypothetical protein